MTTLEHDFIEFALKARVLRFGEFKTKAGRLSPYFFNAGLFNTGSLLDRLGAFYAKKILEKRESGELQFDMLFGPAYKGIPLVASIAINLSRLGLDLPWAFNRKEKKDHGEGGTIIGSPLMGRVLIVDDVISAGTSIRESIAIIRDNGAIPAGVAIALDRMAREIAAVNKLIESESLKLIESQLQKGPRRGGKADVEVEADEIEAEGGVDEAA